MKNKDGMHCFITGKVQGVWFRASTQTQATQLGLTGWVKNLPDGRVEVMAFGDVSALNELLMWLNHGPPLAKVTHLQSEKVTWQEHASFDVI